MQPHKTRAGGGGHIAPPVGTPPAWYFLPSAAESTQRTPPKPMVLESLRGHSAVRSETHLPRESNGAYLRPAFVSSLRLFPCISAYALALAWRSQDLHPLLASRRGDPCGRPSHRTSCNLLSQGRSASLSPQKIRHSFRRAAFSFQVYLPIPGDVSGEIVQGADGAAVFIHGVVDVRAVGVAGVAAGADGLPL